MASWVDWQCPNVEEFPRLRELKLIESPNLKGNLPTHLPSLTRIIIINCPELKDSRVISLPSLVKLEVIECNESVLRSMVDLNSLTDLYIHQISGLSYLDEMLMKSLARVVNLVIDNCRELTCLWKSREQLPSLMTSEEPTHTCGLKFLKKLKIGSCKALETLPDWRMQENNHNQCVLEHLSIGFCPLIRSLHNYYLPPTLKYLDISHCDNLESLPGGITNDGDDINNGNIGCHLEQLKIICGESLKSFPPGKYSRTLRDIAILARASKQVEFFLSEENFEKNSMLQGLFLSSNHHFVRIGLGLGRFMHLTCLEVYKCEGLVSFPENFISSTPNLESLDISSCENLKLLPNEMHKLISLQTLNLCDSPSIIEFPEGGLPPNLTSLIVRNLENLKQPMSEWGLNTLTSLTVHRLENLKQPMSEWGLNTLTALTDLDVWGPSCSTDEIVSFPGCIQLPSSLTEIQICGFKNIEFISSNLRSLASLKYLVFEDCPKLKLLPNEGLPDSLGALTLGKCPLLEERCIKEKGGDYWPLIAHIPLFEIREGVRGAVGSSKVYSGGFINTATEASFWNI